MEGPLALAFNLGHGGDAVAGVLCGIGFGFALERGGFGRANNLAAIFYGRDFRVMRVMFSAIVTAMIGLYLLDLTGFMPLSNIGILPTYLLPQLVGGLLLGTGFIIGGYCPGTSLVGMVSGKIDAVLFVTGLFAGSFAFILSYDAFASFEQKTAWGPVLLHEYFHLPSGVMVVMVALFAVGAFWATSKIEAAVRRSLGAAS
jgi:uncharacterized protein